jgi:cytochrome oxidase Cu insertion factor (SCO1/SenC/PrrC family)
MARLWRSVPALFALAVALAGCHAGSKPGKAAVVREGEPAPDIVGTDQDGKQLKLSDYRGKVVLLDFWASW